MTAGYSIEEDSDTRSAVGENVDPPQPAILYSQGIDLRFGSDNVVDDPVVDNGNKINEGNLAMSPLEAAQYSDPGSVHHHHAQSSYSLHGATPHPATPSSPIEHSSSHELDHSSRLQAILLRYYTEEIAHRFDLCDPEHHFTHVVPQRARSSPPLLNAILTTSARHLCRLRRYRNPSGIVQWQGHLLPGLSQESAVHYHNKCIRDLLALSMDPEQIHNENLLAAAVILRTDEEMDGPLSDGDEDSEVFLRMLNIFINAQIPPTAALTQSSPQVRSSHSLLQAQFHASTASQPSHSANQSVSSPAPDHSLFPVSDASQATSLRRAVFGVALRQELFTSFMKQRALHFQLSHCDHFRVLSPAEDAVWADRAVVFCADVFEYCYGNSSESSRYHSNLNSSERWHELQVYERQLSMALPRSFEPIYSRPADPGLSEVFPEIWHLNTYHRTGTTHLELARILLAVFDPTRPRLGPGAMASQRELGRQLREIVLRLCGIAMCNRQSPPAFIEALMGITTCGEYFETSREQNALLDILTIMGEEQAHPTLKVKNTLRRAWGLASPHEICLHNEDL